MSNGRKTPTEVAMEIFQKHLPGEEPFNVIADLEGSILHITYGRAEMRGETYEFDYDLNDPGSLQRLREQAFDLLFHDKPPS